MKQLSKRQAAAAGSLIVAALVVAWLFAPGKGSNPKDGGEKPNAPDTLHLSEQQLTDAEIKFAPVGRIVLSEHFLVTGTIVPDADKVGRVSVRLIGTVAALSKRVGDPVEKDEVVAVIESRELSDAKSEFLAARLTNDLQQTLAARYKTLWENRTYPENEYFKSRLTAQDAQIRFDSARQKLLALGLSENEISALPEQPIERLRSQSLRAPLAGRIAERRVDVGALVGREGQETELFTIVDLSSVWVELAVSPHQLSKVAEGIEVPVSGGKRGPSGKAKVVFISPLIDKDTRSAKVIGLLDNAGREWRPGMYVTAEMPIGSREPTLAVPKDAVQSYEGGQAVFIKRDDNIVAQKVTVGREDDDNAEILSGLSEGDLIAVSNTFTLKAEMAKGEASHD